MSQSGRENDRCHRRCLNDGCEECLDARINEAARVAAITSRIKPRKKRKEPAGRFTINLTNLPAPRKDMAVVIDYAKLVAGDLSAVSYQ